MTLIVSMVNSSGTGIVADITAAKRPMQKCAREGCNAWLSKQCADQLHCIAHILPGRFIDGSKAQAREKRLTEMRLGRQKVCAEKDCNNLFIPVKKRNIYCSAECRNRGNSRASARQRGDKLRGQGSGKGYIKREGQHEHRLLMESLVGRKLTFNEVVHHKDGNPRNNDPSNLEILQRSIHSAEHSRGGCLPGCTCGRHRSTACKEGCQCGRHKPSWNSKKRDIT